MSAIRALENQTDTAQKAQGAIGLYDMIYAKPFDRALVQEIFSQYDCVISLEDGVIQGGFGQSLAAYCNTIPLEKERQNHTPPKFIHLGIPDQFVSHGKPEVLYAQLGLDASGLTETFRKLLDA